MVRKFILSVRAEKFMCSLLVFVEKFLDPLHNGDEVHLMHGSKN